MDSVIIQKQVDDYIYNGTTFLKSNQYVITEKIERNGIKNPFAMMKAEENKIENKDNASASTSQLPKTEQKTDKKLQKGKAGSTKDKAPAGEADNILTTVYFAFDEYNISPEGYEKLKKIVLKYKDKEKPSLKITGYTDCVGGKEYNDMLALKRAMTVAGYFKTKGFDAVVEGKGDCCFKETEELSRRVEVHIFNNRVKGK